MKIPLFKASCMLFALTCLPQVWAVLPAANPSLPNIDKRRQAMPLAVPAPDAARAKAKAVLESRVPELKISTDKVLGTPRLLSARRGYLTGPNGQGGALSKSFLDAVHGDDPNRV